jgi:hypothetical protein
MNTVTQSIDEAMADLERLGNEINVQVALASMDARDVWREKLEPKLHEARKHACEATTSSQRAIDEIAKAFREFSEAL